MTDITENTTEDLTTATSDVQSNTTEVEATAKTPEPTDLRSTIASALDAQKPAEEPSKANEPEKQAAEAKKPEPQVDPITGRTLEAMKPPASMPPMLREKWGAVDPQFQKYWLDRERDISQTMTRTSDERKFAKEMREAIAPHEDFLREGGITAVQHVGDLLKISRVLHTGTPVQIAGLFDQLLRRYQPDINTLMALSNGQPVQIPHMQAPTPQRSDQEIADAVFAEREAKQREAEAQHLAEQFAADPKNEFFEHLRPRMAALVSAGVFDHLESIDQVYRAAYDTAVANDPEVQAVLRQRAAVPPAVTQQQEIPRTIKPSLGTGKQSKPPVKAMSSREAVEAAWNAAQN